MPIHRKSTLTDHDDGYRLLYGGIDSGGITDRARDITSIMAGVARSHAAESSCPIVLREFYLLPEEEGLVYAVTYRLLWVRPVLKDRVAQERP